jgi:hypothetical protein
MREVLDSHMEFVPLGIKVRNDRLKAPVSVSINHIARITVF